MTTELRTTRLRLRPISIVDAERVETLLLGDVEAVRMTERLPEPCTADAVREWIELRQGREHAMFAIERRDTLEMIGCVGLMRSGRDASLGYWIGRAYWGRGYATEAGQVVIEHARIMGLRRLIAETFTENAASRRVLEKLGFSPGERYRKEVPTRGGWYEVQSYWLVL